MFDVLKSKMMSENLQQGAHDDSIMTASIGSLIAVIQINPLVQKQPPGRFGNC